MRICNANLLLKFTFAIIHRFLPLISGARLSKSNAICIKDSNWRIQLQLHTHTHQRTSTYTWQPGTSDAYELQQLRDCLSNSGWADVGEGSGNVSECTSGTSSALFAVSKHTYLCVYINNIYFTSLADRKQRRLHSSCIARFFDSGAHTHKALLYMYV